MVSSTLVKFVFVCLGSAKRDSSWAARAEGQSQSGSEREGAAADRNTGKISAVLTKLLSVQCGLILIKAISKVLTGHPTSLQSVLSLLVNNYLIHMSLKAWQKHAVVPVLNTRCKLSLKSMFCSLCVWQHWFKDIFHILSTLTLETEQASGPRDLNREIWHLYFC